MRFIVILSFFVLTTSVIFPTAFADHSEVTIETAIGSGVPGCEETLEGCYIPGTVTVDVGGTVIMANTDTLAHTFTSGTLAAITGEFDTGLLLAGTSYEWSPDAPGEYPYLCIVHPWMTGMITVQGDEDLQPDNDEMVDSGHTLDVKPEPVILPTFADDAVIIETAIGSGVAGCENTPEGCYIPGIVTVDVGDTVIMANNDTLAHTFTAGTVASATGEFDTGLLLVGTWYEWSPDAPGEYPYLCIVHPWMTGMITVQGDRNPQPDSDEMVEREYTPVEKPKPVVPDDAVIIETAIGSGVAGCENTPKGCYIPGTVTVDVGDTIIMANTDTLAHTFTAGTVIASIDAFDTGLLLAGASYEWSPDVPGEYPYFCLVHPWKTGMITVQGDRNPQPDNDEMVEREYTPKDKPEPEVPTIFADHSEVTIETAIGSGVPECENTPEGCYIPGTVTVDVGGTVIMSNTDTLMHTFTAGTMGSTTGEFDTGLLLAGASYEWSPDTIGEYPYFCLIYPWMTGMITVQEAEGDEMTDDHGMMDMQGEAAATKMLSDGTMVSVWSSTPTEGEPLKIDIEFNDSEHVNYDIRVMQNNEDVLHDKGVHDHMGKGTHLSGPLSSSEPVDATVTFQGYGVDDPKTGPIGETIIFTNIVSESKGTTPDQDSTMSKNTRLEISPIRWMLIDEGALLAFTVRLTDNTINDLAFSLINSAPSDARITNTGMFTWTPTDSDGGKTHIFDVEVRKDGMYDTQRLAITVNDSIDQTTGIKGPQIPAVFVSLEHDPQHYIDRYNNEPRFKQWFDYFHPEYDSIYHAVGLEEPKETPSEHPIRSTATVPLDGILASDIILKNDDVTIAFFAFTHIMPAVTEVMLNSTSLDDTETQTFVNTVFVGNMSVPFTTNESFEIFFFDADGHVPFYYTSDPTTLEEIPLCVMDENFDGYNPAYGATACYKDYTADNDEIMIYATESGNYGLLQSELDS